ncbi:uncharacterized protein [Rutidosis leptorrhynchoides]|uniref:uncharacterized protein n=1 Tax=Rutidosis leptorrhynchoides TaxID=125765 RepID=UPI003A9925DB
MVDGNSVFTGKNRNNTKSVLPGIPPERLPVFSQSSNFFPNKPHDSSLSGQSKFDMWGDRKVRGLDISERTHPESVVASNIPSPYPFGPASDLTKSWSPSVSSWEKLSSNLNQNSMSARVHPCLNSSSDLNRSSQSSSQSHGIFGDRWHLNGNVRLMPGNESESSNQNGFYHGSSSGSKEHPICIPSAHYEYLNSSNNRNLTSEQFSNHSSGRVPKDSNCVNLKFPKEVNLNVTISNDSPEPSLEILESGQKHDQKNSTGMLPWLKSLPASNSNKSNGKTEINDCSSTKKILGVPILDSKVKNEGRLCRLLDINLPCEPPIPDLELPSGAGNLEKGMTKQDRGLRHEIDLNMCLSEDEASLVTSPVPSTRIKRTLGFDLEAPVVLESDDDVARGVEEPEAAEKFLEADHHPEEESMRMMAAEAIVSISSSILHHNDDVTSGERDPLQFLADVVICCGEELENKYEVMARKLRAEAEEIDYFELMTLKLPETTEEEYMPKPLVPDHINLDEAVGPSPAQVRPVRKGPGRRGRQQRKDFQRDILPGLTSLSRQEVTEDMRTFGGLMLATGHAWSGLSRRNGSGRGRRRAAVVANNNITINNPPPPLPAVVPPLVQQQAQQQQQQLNMDVGLEDRNLTGWGKTTRRPRRQRCAPGNNASAVPLT